MSRSNTVLFVSAGMLAPKKRDHPLARRQLYLNYGALTLATQLQSQGIDTRLAHGAHQAPADFLASLFAGGLLPSAHPVMLSLPSFYALGWAQLFCRDLKALDPHCRIVVGGRWVTNPDPEWLAHRLPEASEIVCGLGEAKINGLIGLNDRVSDGKLPDFPLNHRLVQNFEEFQPSLEASRGCGMGCHFCEERDIPLSHLKDPAMLAEHLADLRDQYNGEEIHPYLQSSYFLPNPRWARKLEEEVQKRELTLSWRTETRVDGMKTETVEHLAAAGLKVIDLGLETASPTQILAMGKSTRPDHYLKAASQLLHDCRSNGIAVKVNVLMYAGETTKTLAETRAWLDDHSNAIKGVSVGPVLVFGPPKQAAPLLAELAEQGANPIDPASADRDGITALHLSSDFDFHATEAVCLEMSRRYMSQDDYFELKSFSYYPRRYSRSDFDADIAASPAERLPFSV